MATDIRGRRIIVCPQSVPISFLVPLESFLDHDFYASQDVKEVHFSCSSDDVCQVTVALRVCRKVSVCFELPRSENR